jgi:hypothetical protein
VAFIIRLERRVGAKTDPPVVMWLVSQMPTKWGPREQAMRFKTKGDARRAAGILRMSGAWSVEQAEPL